MTKITLKNYFFRSCFSFIRRQDKQSSSIPLITQQVCLSVCNDSDGIDNLGDELEKQSLDVKVCFAISIVNN